MHLEALVEQHEIGRDRALANVFHHETVLRGFRDMLAADKPPAEVIHLVPRNDAE